MDLKLNEFPTSDVSYFTVKNSKGLKKRVKIGAELVESDKLTIALDPYCNCETFALTKSCGGGLVFEQSFKGNIILQITDRITLEGSEQEPETNYLCSEVRGRNTDGKWSTKTIYVGLKFKEENNYDLETEN